MFSAAGVMVGGELLPLRDDGIHVAHDEFGKTHERLPEHESMDGDSNISPSGEKYTTADARLPGDFILVRYICIFGSLITAELWGFQRFVEQDFGFLFVRVIRSLSASYG